jgi:hypothetical protein
MGWGLFRMFGLGEGCDPEFNENDIFIEPSHCTVILARQNFEVMPVQARNPENESNQTVNYP